MSKRTANNTTPLVNGENSLSALQLKTESPGERFKSLLFDNKVTILFSLLCIAAIIVSGSTVEFMVSGIITRFGRNAFTVLSLIIPVLAGMGLNFSITIGAMATQVGLFWVVYWGFEGLTGILVCLLVATPLSLFFGFLVGKLFNQMKGAEMIAGLVLGYFADGLYQLFFLFILGGIIPVKSEKLMIPGNIGVKNTIDLSDNVKYALDRIPLRHLLWAILAVAAISLLARIWRAHQEGKKTESLKIFKLLLLAIVLGLSFLPAWQEELMKDQLNLTYALRVGSSFLFIYMLLRLVEIKQNKLLPVPAKKEKQKRSYLGLALAIIGMALSFVSYVIEIGERVFVPVLPFLLVFALCTFNRVFLTTRLGQNMRTVGQSQTVANASGINVDRTRVIAMMISTVLASWGQLIYLQNLGTFATYGAHLQVGQFAIAAILVGGASVQNANNRQAILGVILFHTLFIAAPQAGKQLFNNAQIGEYFRVFVSYGVIALSLAMHAWKRKPKAHELLSGTNIETQAVSE